MNWRYTDASNSVVVRTNDDGSMQSAAVSSPEIQAFLAAGGVPDAFIPPPQEILPQDLVAQFTPADMVKIGAAMAADLSGQTALLWYAMVAQRDPMMVTNVRFKAGWAALATVLGAGRMAAIASALGVTLV